MVVTNALSGPLVEPAASSAVWAVTTRVLPLVDCILDVICSCHSLPVKFDRGASGATGALVSITLGLLLLLLLMAQVLVLVLGFSYFLGGTARARTSGQNILVPKSIGAHAGKKGLRP